MFFRLCKDCHRDGKCADKGQHHDELHSPTRIDGVEKDYWRHKEADAGNGDDDLDEKIDSDLGVQLRICSFGPGLLLFRDKPALTRNISVYIWMREAAFIT